MTKREAFNILAKLSVKYNENTNQLKHMSLILIKLLFFAGRYKNALYHTNKLSKVMNTSELYCWKGVLYHLLNDFNNAIHFLEKAERSNPFDMEIKYLMAEIYFAGLQIEKAKTKYRILTSNTNYKHVGFYGIGCCLLKLNRPDEALTFFNKALSFANKSDLIKILNKKGLCLIQLGKTKDALSCFEECLKLSPDNKNIQLNLALTMSKLEKFKEAAEIYKNLLKKFPNNLIIINNYASCLAACNHYRKALHYCNKGLKIDPTNPDLLINKGYCLYKLKQYNMALECLNEAEKIAKDDIILLNNKALCLMALKKYDEALNLFDNIQDKNSVSDDLLINKAFCLVQKGMYNEALTCLKAVKNKKNHDYYNLMGVCFEQLGDYDAAVENFNKSLIIA